MSINEAIQKLEEEMRRGGIFPEQGLGEELFLFSSTLAPVINTDLLITDKDERVLLSWRNDSFHHPGWHVPGTCIRFRETFEQSIRRCARDELRTKIDFSPEPIKVYEMIRETNMIGIANREKRTHFITLVFACRLAREGKVFSEDELELKPGTLKWFQGMPENMTTGQECYQRDWDLLLEKIRKTQRE